MKWKTKNLNIASNKKIQKNNLTIKKWIDWKYSRDDQEVQQSIQKNKNKPNSFTKLNCKKFDEILNRMIDLKI